MTTVLRQDSRIYVAGRSTLIGAALVRQLNTRGYRDLCHAEPEPARPEEIDGFFRRRRPEYVFVAAGKSGGIAANQKYPADFMLDNLLWASQVIEAAWRHGVRKLLYLASSCIYPKHCPQPMKPEHLLTGPLEPTNEAYALAKLAGLKLCQAYRAQYGAHFIAGIPANPYGPGDKHDAEDAHVIIALLRKMHDAKTQGRPSVTIWGTGAARREFIYVDDLAEACLVAMDRYDEDAPINLGGGQDCSIRELAEMIKEVVGFRGRLEFDHSRPDGMPYKSLDSARLLELGWRPTTSLREGLRATYRWIVSGE